MFTTDFPRYAGPGDTIECAVDGLRCVATLQHDYDADPPWENDDGHGPVTGWLTRDKRAGELVLCEDRGSRRFYDFAEAVRMARAKGWGFGGKSVDDHMAGGMTIGQVAAAAAREDYENLRAWCRDEWFYVGVAVQLFDSNDEPINDEYDNALWRCDCNHPCGEGNSYLTEVANDLLEDALASVRAKSKAPKLEMTNWSA